MVVKVKRTVSDELKVEKKLSDTTEMDISLNPGVEKNWRRLTLSLMFSPAEAVSKTKPEKPLSKTAIKRLETERHLMEVCMMKIEWIGFRQMIMLRNDEVTKKMGRYERQTLAELRELAELKKLTVPTAHGGKRAYIMALVRLDLTAPTPPGSSSSSGS